MIDVGGERERERGGENLLVGFPLGVDQASFFFSFFFASLL
jgi:hypothetical protein